MSRTATPVQANRDSRTGEPRLAYGAVRAARGATLRHRRRVLAGLALLVTGAFLARVLLGDYTITVPDFLTIVGGGTAPDVPGASFVLMDVKLPRAVLAVVVGAAFGVGGAIFQAVLRNPLASPDIVGVSIGASAAAVTAIITLGLTGPVISVWAVCGALGTALAIRLVARGSGPARGRAASVSAYRLVLYGVVAAAVLQSVIQYLFTRADLYDAQLTLRWLMGSVSSADWPTIRVLAVVLLLLLPAVAWVARTLPVVELGSDAATALGEPPARADLMLLLGVLLVAVAVAAAGPIAFVAFLSGPVSRALNHGRTSLAGAALVGALTVVAGDYVGDYLVPGGNYPVGVVTGAVGAPFLLWLLVRGRRHQEAA
jgi:iron complex transport system permease protein